jgi:hypothetical protein
VLPARAGERHARMRRTARAFRRARGGARRDGNRPALRHAEKCEASEPGGVGDGFDVAYPRVERELPDVAIRQAATARIIAKQRVVARQLGKPGNPYRTGAIEFQMREPRSDLEQGWPVAEPRVREPDALGVVQKRIS